MRTPIGHHNVHAFLRMLTGKLYDFFSNKMRSIITRYVISSVSLNFMSLVNKPPVLICPSEISKMADRGSESTAVYWSYKDVWDDYQQVSRLTCDPAWGSEFYVGQTTVNCTAVDDHGNHVSCDFNVTVVCK